LILAAAALSSAVKPARMLLYQTLATPELRALVHFRDGQHHAAMSAQTSQTSEMAAAAAARRRRCAAERARRKRERHAQRQLVETILVDQLAAACDPAANTRVRTGRDFLGTLFHGSVRQLMRQGYDADDASRLVLDRLGYYRRKGSTEASAPVGPGTSTDHIQPVTCHVGDDVLVKHTEQTNSASPVQASFRVEAAEPGMLQ
jgi:hypothetical protein